MLGESTAETGAEPFLAVRQKPEINPNNMTATDQG